MAQSNSAAPDTSKLMDKIVSLAKRRGFIFQSSEIYGGLNGCWDYGPLGVEMLNNVKQQWWKSMTYRENVEGLDASILMHPRVWEASGHVENFTDPMVDCKQCKARYRIDVLFEDLSVKKKKDILRELDPGKFEGQQKDEVILKEFEARAVSDEFLAKAVRVLACPNCGNKGTFTDARKFNLMFKTFVGPVEDSSNVVFLRPETAQGIFVNFLNVQTASRQKIPFGIAQIGKAFRNEINTKNFLFRTREFEQMEMQFFVKPGTDDQHFEYWREERMQWFVNLGMRKERLQWHQHPKEKLAHYAKDAYDIEYQFPFGWGEIEGVHNRTDFDLSRHEQFSGKTMKYFDEETKEKFTPFVIETSAGASRSFMAFLVDSYREEEAPTAEGGMEMRTVLKLHPALAPTKIAIFPLVNRDGMPEISRSIEADLRTGFRVFYDDSGAVGRRYRRQDEVGTPYCVTVDSETLQNKTVTVRDRDSMQQERIAVDRLKEYFTHKLT
ncbi:MAG TPA: glycine--tRNA ligase [Bacteroidota bacterium]|nr:glycine--tRNA ligase [Bacteroidota bacterium]